MDTPRLAYAWSAAAEHVADFERATQDDREALERTGYATHAFEKVTAAKEIEATANEAIAAAAAAAAAWRSTGDARGAHHTALEKMSAFTTAAGTATTMWLADAKAIRAGFHTLPGSETAAAEQADATRELDEVYRRANEGRRQLDGDVAMIDHLARRCH